jgi:F-type H+-transporting ATPase subunit gamma
MQMVAASKMRKAQEAALAGRPFVRLMYRIQRVATTRAVDFRHPLLEVRPVRKRAIILVASDKGLCGSLNSNVFRLASQYDPETTLFVTAGKRAAQFVARTGRQLIAEFEYSDTPTYPQACAIAAFARDLFIKKDADQVSIVATRFINTMTQHAMSIEFLPIGEILALGTEGKEFEKALAADKTESLFEPGPEDVLGYLLSHYINIHVYQTLLNAKASEQSARMVAMKNATENAENLIEDLKLEYNKLRQGNITRDLLDIAGGQSG